MYMPTRNAVPELLRPYPVAATPTADHVATENPDDDFSPVG